MVTVLIISAKMADVDFIKVFQNKVYGVKITVHDVANKIISSDSNHIVDFVM